MLHCRVGSVAAQAEHKGKQIMASLQRTSEKIRLGLTNVGNL